MGISPGRTRPCMYRSEREQCVPINAFHSAALDGTRSGRMSLKKCVFGCEGTITLFSFPKNPALRKQWKQFVFPGQQQSFSSVFVDERFINKAQFDAGFAHRLILKDGAVPAIKDPGHDSELQTVSETASNVFNQRSSARHSLAPPTCRASRSLAFFGENCKAVSFFYKYDKTKNVWRYEGCSTTL